MMIKAYDLVAELPEDQERDLDELLTEQRVFDTWPPGYVSASEAAKETSTMREIMYRAECLEQERQWKYQVSELREIIDYLDPDARERTIDYMEVAGKIAAACRLMSGNRSDGFAAWNFAGLEWGQMFLDDLRDWIGRRANGTDRANGSDFPFADILNKIPDFTEIPKLPKDRDENGR
jgi:hypothetical protein